MPDLVNTLDHPVRVTADGREHRVVPGQVVSAEGELADALVALRGIETADDDHREAWEAERARRAGQISPVTAGGPSMDKALTDLRSLARKVSVAVPLNQVIGDDDAPLGPPSGTITTKQAVARVDEEHNKAFGNRERMPEDREKNLSPVERLQAEAAAEVESIHNELLEDQAEQGNEAVSVELSGATNSAEVEGEASAEKPKRRSKKGARGSDGGSNESGSDANPA
jgi:hypothetical protein